MVDSSDVFTSPRHSVDRITCLRPTFIELLVALLGLELRGFLDAGSKDPYGFCDQLQRFLLQLGGRNTYVAPAGPGQVVRRKGELLQLWNSRPVV